MAPAGRAPRAQPCGPFLCPGRWPQRATPRPQRTGDGRETPSGHARRAPDVRRSRTAGGGGTQARHVERPPRAGPRKHQRVGGRSGPDRPVPPGRGLATQGWMGAHRAPSSGDGKKRRAQSRRPSPEQGGVKKRRAQSRDVSPEQRGVKKRRAQSRSRTGDTPRRRHLTPWSGFLRCARQWPLGVHWIGEVGD